MTCLLLFPGVLRAQRLSAGSEKSAQAQRGRSTFVVSNIEKKTLQMILAARARVALQRKELEAKFLQALAAGDSQSAAVLKEELKARGLLVQLPMLPFQACQAKTGEAHAGRYVIYGEQGDVRRAVTPEEFDAQYMPAPGMEEGYFVTKNPRDVVQITEEAAGQLSFPFAVEAGDYLDITDLNNMGSFPAGMFLTVTPAYPNADDVQPSSVLPGEIDGQVLIDALSFPPTVSLQLETPQVYPLGVAQQIQTHLAKKIVEIPNMYNQINWGNIFHANNAPIRFGNDDGKFDPARRQNISMRPRTIAQLGLTTGFVTSKKTVQGTVSVSGKLFVFGVQHLQHFTRKTDLANDSSSKDVVDLASTNE